MEEEEEEGGAELGPVVEEEGGALSSGEHKDGGHRHQQEQEVLPNGPSATLHGPEVLEDLLKGPRAVTQIALTAVYFQLLCNIACSLSATCLYGSQRRVWKKKEMSQNTFFCELSDVRETKILI